MYRIPLVLVFWMFAFSLQIFAQSNTLVYKGKLTDGGKPANGGYDFVFRFFDDKNKQIGSDFIEDGIWVTKGDFFVRLELEDDLLPGSIHSLGILVGHGNNVRLVSLEPMTELNVVSESSGFSLSGQARIEPSRRSSPPGPVSSSGLGNGSGLGTGRGLGTGNGTGRNDPGEIIDKNDAETPRLPPAAPEKNTPVKILSKPRAPYTDIAKKNDVQGVVTLKITLLANGQIGAVSVVKGLPDGLTQSAIDAARQIKFEPKKVNGVAVSVTQEMSYNFNIY